MSADIQNGRSQDSLTTDFKKKARENIISERQSSQVPIWNKKVLNTEIEKFSKIIEKKYDLKFDSYRELHQWSIKNTAQFWEEVWSYFGIVSSKPFDKAFVKTGPGLLDNEWFVGAEFNYAENILRIRDDRVALMYSDEEGTFGTVTFAELFEEVKLFAAAFRKNGLQKGDRVACYMSNLKEAIYAMLAATSIGAVWGGSQPYYGAQASANIIQMMEPKFLITVDEHTDSSIHYNLLDNLPTIVDSTPSLEKVIIIPTKEKTLSKNLSHICNSIFLTDFLDTGKLEDGTVPDIVFEQLPPSHPVFITFTSGTTGLPKAPVHSASCLLGFLIDIGLSWNLKSGDSIFSVFPMGWMVWNMFVPCLALGIKLFLYCGDPASGHITPNTWDILGKYKITFLIIITSVVDRMEKLNLKPSSDARFEHLKMVGIGGSPVKTHNFEYIRKIAGDNVFVGSVYGGTEVVGNISGFYLNLPYYAGELQVPALGKDIQCFDENGISVIGQRGDLVITGPYPSFPLYLWKDDDSKNLNLNYLSKYPGVWCQNDELWINPVTGGMVVHGRSDDTIIQNGDRFGSGDIYFAIHGMEEIQDYMCVGQTKKSGDVRAVLFVKVKDGYTFNNELKEKISQKIKKELYFDCVPEVILEIKDIPYNANNKRMESVVRKIVATNKIPKVSNIRNPECLKYYCDIPEVVNS